MALFKSQTHQDIWIGHHCERCHFHGPDEDNQCRILDKALRSGRKPVEWERNTRTGALMAETMKCNSETRTPPRIGGRVADDETLALFDMDAEHS